MIHGIFSDATLSAIWITCVAINIKVGEITTTNESDPLNILGQHGNGIFSRGKSWKPLVEGKLNGHLVEQEDRFYILHVTRRACFILSLQYIGLANIRLEDQQSTSQPVLLARFSAGSIPRQILAKDCESGRFPHRMSQ